MRVFIAAVVLVTSSVMCFADAVGNLAALEQGWLDANYTQDEDSREQKFERLMPLAGDILATDPNNAELLIWYGQIIDSYADNKSGIGTLGLRRQAKEAWEKAIDNDPNALQGSAYTYLGLLYAKVPGWPVSFGDEDKSVELLKQSVIIAPDSLNTNLVYGRYLFDQGEYKSAITALEKALDAQPRPGFEKIDGGQRREASSLLLKAKIR